jgi:5'-deoxynucleotidase
MQNSFFALIFRQKYIRRWGLMRNVSNDTLAEHSAQVAMLAHALGLIGNKRLGKNYDLGAITVAALYHDGTEVYTGDLPTPVKYNSPELRQSYKLIEEQAALTLLSHLPEDLRDEYAPLLREEFPEEIHRLVKAADKLAAYIKCVEEVKFGNTEFMDAKKTTYAALKERALPELEIFLEEFLPAFELTLDEMQG